MAYNTKEVLKDVDGNPISQYYDPITDSYKPVEGSSGGNKVTVENNQGLSLIPILDKLSQLTGTVIDEESRKSNEAQRIIDEDIRKSNESTRVSSESTRANSENTRKTQELGRVSAESSRVTVESSRVTAENTRQSQESTRQSRESSRQSNEGVRESQESNRESNEGLRIALYDDLQSKLTSGFFKGEKGDTGNGLEYTWNGTQLGVRVEGTTQYVYVDLKGEKGDTGSIDNLTSNHVTTALGYNPISPTQLNSKVQTDVPSGAKFTDTITTKTSELTNDSGFLTSVTKSDVGLSNVTNDKQMPVSGGTLENYSEKVTTVSASGGSINLSLGNVFQHTPSVNTAYTITNPVSGVAHSFTLIINMGATARTLTFPSSVKWQGGEIPDLTTASKTYVLTFMTVDGGTNWLGMFGGEF